MKSIQRITLTDHDETARWDLENGGLSSSHALHDNKSTSLSCFVDALIEAHRYVHNRRSASTHST